MKCYFFGTFDPIHSGHIKIANIIKEKFNFEQIVFVPSYMPPHKLASGMTPFNHRLNMTKLAVGDENTSDIELKLQIPSYSYKTIQKLIEADKTERINFIIGYDQFFTIENRKEPEILKKLVHFIVVPRKFKNGQSMNINALNYFKKKGYSFDHINIDFLEVASSEIRALIENKKDITGLLDKKVIEYIETNGLYIKPAKRKVVG